MTIESLSAITLVTRDMTSAVKFYQSLGFERLKGGAGAAFTSFKAGAQYLNLLLGEESQAVVSARRRRQVLASFAKERRFRAEQWRRK